MKSLSDDGTRREYEDFTKLIKNAIHAMEVRFQDSDQRSAVANLIHSFNLSFKFIALRIDNGILHVLYQLTRLDFVLPYRNSISTAAVERQRKLNAKKKTKNNRQRVKLCFNFQTSSRDSCVVWKEGNGEVDTNSVSRTPLFRLFVVDSQKTFQHSLLVDTILFL